MKLLITVLSFILIVATCVMAGDSFTGKYEMKSKQVGGRINLKALDGNKIKFSIGTATVGGHTCEADGEAVLNAVNKTAIFKGEENCSISFKFEGNKVKVVTDSCFQYCGISGYMDGIFTKVSGKPNFSGAAEQIIVYSNLEKFKEENPHQGLFKDKKISADLKKLLGKYYKTLLNNIDSVDIYNGVKYSNGTLTVSGGIPGLFTISEAIIQIEQTGMIYAAILDKGEKILYFTNSPIYRDSLPSALSEWAKRFEGAQTFRMSQ